MTKYNISTQIWLNLIYFLYSISQKFGRTSVMNKSKLFVNLQFSTQNLKNIFSMIYQQLLSATVFCVRPVWQAVWTIKNRWVEGVSHCRLLFLGVDPRMCCPVLRPWPVLLFTFLSCVSPCVPSRLSLLNSPPFKCIVTCKCHDALSSHRKATFCPTLRVFKCKQPWLIGFPLSMCLHIIPSISFAIYKLLCAFRSEMYYSYPILS